jgi:hypothetical protein
MLAERAPTAWLASQTIQRAASTVASSSLNVAVQVVDTARPKAVLVQHDEAFALDPCDAIEGGEEFLDGAGNLGHVYIS